MLRPPSRQKTPPKFIVGDSNGLDLPSTPRTPPEIDMNIEHYRTGVPEGKGKEVWRSLERLSSDSSLSAVSDPAKSLSVGEDEMALNESATKGEQEGQSRKMRTNSTNVSKRLVQAGVTAQQLATDGGHHEVVHRGRARTAALVFKQAALGAGERARQEQALQEPEQQRQVHQGAEHAEQRAAPARAQPRLRMGRELREEPLAVQAQRAARRRQDHTLLPGVSASVAPWESPNRVCSVRLRRNNRQQEGIGHQLQQPLKDIDGCRTIIEKEDYGRFKNIYDYEIELEKGAKVATAPPSAPTGEERKTTTGSGRSRPSTRKSNKTTGLGETFFLGNQAVNASNKSVINNRNFSYAQARKFAGNDILLTLDFLRVEIGMTEKPLSLENTENFDFKELGTLHATSSSDVFCDGLCSRNNF